mmetsp:Transcript_12714/g.28494  ORF Transcript_12714/g.28494 Transcript_12714/m.28494 type:complete len:256 (-) Transcript_12714:334-1101(-)
MQPGELPLVGELGLGLGGLCGAAEGQVHDGVGEVVHGCVQVARLHGGQDVLDRGLARDRAVVLRQLLGQLLVEGGAEPVHAVVHHVLDLGVPGLVHGQQRLVVVGHRHVARELHPVDEAGLPVAQADDEVAGAVGGFHVGQGGLQAVRVLHHVSQYEHPRLASHLLGRRVVRALPEAVVWEGHAYLRDGQLLVREAREQPHVGGPAHIRVGVALGGVVDGHLGEVLEGPVGVKVQGTELVGNAGATHSLVPGPEE